MDNPGKDEGLHKKQQPVFSRTAAFIFNYVHIGLTQQTGKLFLSSFYRRGDYQSPAHPIFQPP